MKPLKLAKAVMRFWIALTATGSFLVGWALFAHAPKPVSSNSPGASTAAPLPTLAPLAPLNISGSAAGGGFANLQFGVQPQAPLFMQAPLFRTSGS